MLNVHDNQLQETINIVCIVCVRACVRACITGIAKCVCVLLWYTVSFVKWYCGTPLVLL